MCRRLFLTVQLALVIATASVLLKPASASDQANPEAKRVRILLALDTDAKGGPAWGLDGDNLRAMLEHTIKQQKLDGRVTIDHFIGKDCGAATILDHYAKLDTGPDEALVFYYSGHGGWNGKLGHFLALSHGRLYREDLLAAMSKKNPRLTVVLTDCCANLSGGAWHKEPAGAVERTNDAEISDAVAQTAVRQEPALSLETALPARASGKTGKAKQPTPAKEAKAKIQEPPSQEIQLTDDSAESLSAHASTLEPKSTEVHSIKILTAKNKGMQFDELLSKTDGKVLRDLMFSNTGFVDINACRAGLLSSGSEKWGGSLFTNALLLLQAESPEKLGVSPATVMTWDRYFPILQQKTEAVARGVSGSKSPQSPEAFTPIRSK